MSSPPASNIVSFPSASADGTPSLSVTAAPDSLLGQIQTLWRDRMSAAVAGGLDKLIDEFYTEAEHALERDTRDFWLKAKDAWPGQRRAIETAFKHELIECFAPKAEEAKSVAEFSSIESSWSELSLVDDGALEEDMRFAEMVGRIRGGADEELAQLDLRMAVVLGKETLKAEDNPLSPATLCKAFRHAIKGVELDLKVKIPVLRVFAESARPEANKLFREVNALLKERGILPTIKYGSTKKPQTGGGPGATGVKSEGPQVIGSVTLPIMANPGAGGVGAMPLVGGMPMGIGAVSMPAGGMSIPAGGASLPGGMPASGASSGGDAASGSAVAVPGTGAPGVGVGMALPGTGSGDAAVDPFAMLQQLMMMNLGAVRSSAGAPGIAGGMPGGGGVPANQLPGAAGPGGVGGLGMGSGVAGFGSGMPGVPGTTGFPAGGVGPGAASAVGGAHPGTAQSALAAGVGGGFPHPPGGPGNVDGASTGGGMAGPFGPGLGGQGTGGSGGPSTGSGGGGGYVGSGGPAGAADSSGGSGSPGGGSDSGGGGYPGGQSAHGGVPQGGPGTASAPTNGGNLGSGSGSYPVGGQGGSSGAGGGGFGAPGGGSSGAIGIAERADMSTTGFAGGAVSGFAGGPGGGGGLGVPGAVGGIGGPAGSGPTPSGGSAGTGSGAGGFTGPAGAMGAPQGHVITPPGFAPAPADGGGFPTLDPAIAQHATGQFGSGTTTTGGFPVLNMTGVGGGGLIGSLTRLQQGDLGALPDMPLEVREWLSNAPASATSNLPIPPRNVLQALKQTSLAQQFGQVDTVTLDIVAMLFDQIFGDPRVPPAMKALIGRLQIPMLKVAVLDKTFFSRKTHPARRMLDMLGELSLGLGDGFGPDNPLYRRLESTLSQLVEQFEEDFGVFDRMTELYESMIAELNGQAVAAAKVEEKRIQDRERLEVARLFAQNELRTRIAGHQLPKAVLRFLSTDWMKLLILAYAKGGRDSRAWHSLLETLDILVWSLTPKTTVDERKRLVSLLPGLLKRLAKGMDVVGTDSFMRERFNAVLMRCHSRTIAGGSAVGGMPPSRTNIPRARPTAPIPVETATAAPATDTSPEGSVAETPLPPLSIAEPAAEPGPVDMRVDFEVDRTITPGLPTTSPVEWTPPPAPTEAAAVLPEPTTEGAIPPSLEPAPPATATPPRPFGGGLADPTGITVEEVSFDSNRSMEMHDITAPMAEEPTTPAPMIVPPGTEPAILQTGGAGPLQEEMLPAEVPSTFPTVTVKNPFGDGEIEVEEVSFNDLPGFASPMSTHIPPPPPDEYVTRVNAMKEGDWVEIHQEGKDVVQARLSLVSPYRSTFVFSSRKGQKVAEYSLYQVTSYLRSGRLVLLEDVPLFDRAFGNLVNILRKGAETAA